MDGPGPVLISVPMDVQADAADVPEARAVELPEPPAPRPPRVAQVRAALADAERPVLLAGGGVVQSGASARFRQIAEHLGLPVVATYQAKGVLPEDHPLYGRYPGSKGTDTGNALCREADVIVAIGCRFADEAASSYVPGVTFSIPPTKLYQVDIDEYEIGKNYPVELGVVADAKAFCEALWAIVARRASRRGGEAHWQGRIADLVVPWNAKLAPGRTDRSLPLRISAVLDIVHDAVPPDTIVLTGAGHSQAQFLQEYTVNDASQVISPNGFSTMGFTIPGAIGARLAAPDRPVLGFAGDGDFLMTVQELAMAVQYGLDVIYVVVDNAGWQSIRDLQMDVYGEEHGFAAEFRTPTGASITPDLVTVARGFGVKASEATDEPGAQGGHRPGARGGRTDGHRRARPSRVPPNRPAPRAAGGTFPCRRRCRSAEGPTKGRWHRSDEMLSSEADRDRRSSERHTGGQGMTRFGTMWRRGFVLAASLALLASVAPAATFAQDEGGSVDILTYFSVDLGEKALASIVEEFTAETGIAVNFGEIDHENYKTAILVQLAGGNPPDALTDWAGARAAFKVQNGALMPIDDMWAENRPRR